MDSKQRTWTKAIGWQLLGLTCMLGVGYGFTGSFALGGAMALINAMIGLITYVIYERLWARIRWGAAHV